MDFTGLNKKAGVNIFWKSYLETQKLFSLVNFLKMRSLLYKIWR